MASNDVTITLHGDDIPLSKFAEAVERFTELLTGIAKLQRGGENIAWLVAGLSLGSAELTVEGESEDTAAVTATLEGVAAVGTALSRNLPIATASLDRPARALVAVLDSDITAIELRVLDQDIEITTPSSVRPSNPVRSYGSVQGSILTITWRRGFKFTLFDTLHNKPVVCHAREEQEDLVLRMGNRRVAVEGLVSRDPETGRPIDIREIRDIIPVEYKPGDYQLARGLFPSEPDDPKPEELIRRIRDAW